MRARWFRGASPRPAMPAPGGRRSPQGAGRGDAAASGSSSRAGRSGDAPERVDRPEVQRVSVSPDTSEAPKPTPTARRRARRIRRLPVCSMRRFRRHEWASPRTMTRSLRHTPSRTLRCPRLATRGSEPQRAARCRRRPTRSCDPRLRSVRLRRQRQQRQPLPLCNAASSLTRLNGTRQAQAYLKGLQTN